MSNVVYGTAISGLGDEECLRARSLILRCVTAFSLGSGQSSHCFASEYLYFCLRVLQLVKLASGNCGRYK